MQSPEAPEPVEEPPSSLGRGAAVFAAVFAGLVGLLAGIVVSVIAFEARTWETIVSALVVGGLAAGLGWAIVAVPSKHPPGHA